MDFPFGEGVIEANQWLTRKNLFTEELVDYDADALLGLEIVDVCIEILGASKGRRLWALLNTARSSHQSTRIFNTLTKPQSAISLSALKEEGRVDSNLILFLRELVKLTSISFYVNGHSIGMDLENNDHWFQSIDMSALSTSEVKSILNIPEDILISEEDISKYSLIYDPKNLHEMGKIDYQNKFNQDNSKKMTNYILITHLSNQRIPIAKQHEEGIFKFCGKVDNLHMLRPLAIEFKGPKFKSEHQPANSLADRHFQVLEQSLPRVYSISCIQQYLGNIGVFAVCFDRIWLVWYERKITSKIQENIHVFKIGPKELNDLWVLLTKQALIDRNVMFVQENKDFYYLTNFLNQIHPKIAHYSRSRFVNMSMNRVYAISLPQLLNNNAITLCVSKQDKHFAIKVIPNQIEFEAEVKCIEKINKYIFENELPNQFYAIGSKKWGESYVSYNSAVDFEFIGRTISNKIFRSSLEKTFENLNINENEPWWLYEPTPSMPLEGGVIVMICGDLYQRITTESIIPMVHGVKYWLDLYNKAQVVHRDIRESNIVRFDDPPMYSAFVSRVKKVQMSQNWIQWQLIDFNLGHSFENDENSVLTKLVRGTTQCKNAGWKIQELLEEIPSSQELKHSWTFEDDHDMLICLILKLTMIK